MSQVQRGFRSKLDKYISIAEPFAVEMLINGSAVYDFSCFGVDQNNKLSDDRYMVFYNQISSPNREITAELNPGKAVFTVNLEALPAVIDKLVFTVSIDGLSSMGEIKNHDINIYQGGRCVLNASFLGSDFFSEKAVISLEIYRKGVWRVNFVAQGFCGGLPDLLTHYGGEEAKENEPPAEAVNTQSYSEPAPAAPEYAAEPSYSQSASDASWNQSYSEPAPAAPEYAAEPSYSQSASDASWNQSYSEPAPAAPEYAAEPSYNQTVSDASWNQSYSEPAPAASEYAPEPVQEVKEPVRKAALSLNLGGSLSGNEALEQKPAAPAVNMFESRKTRILEIPVSLKRNRKKRQTEEIKPDPVQDIAEPAEIKEFSIDDYLISENSASAGSEDLNIMPDCRFLLEAKLSSAPELKYLAAPLSDAIISHNLENQVVRVVFIVDASGSMTSSWIDGSVQEISNMILPVATYFSQNAQFDIWFFAQDSMHSSTVTAETYKYSIPSISGGSGETLSYFDMIRLLGSFNDEKQIVKSIIDKYGSSDIPVYAVFVSGGGIEEDEELSRLMQSSLRLPIFWQFIGLSGKEYGIFEHPENAGSVCNSDFFEVNNIKATDKSWFYNRLMDGFDEWIHKAKISGIF